MKPIFEKVPKQYGKAIFIKQYSRPVLDMPYHYHPEYEITLTEKRPGKRFIGNSVEAIDDQDLMFLGSNLPHCFLGDPDIHPDSNLIVLQFDMDIWGDSFLNKPEGKPLKDIMHKSQRGMLISGSSIEVIKGKMMEMIAADPLKRVILLLEILYAIANESNYRLLISKKFEKQYHNQDYHKLNEVYNFIIQNFKNEIRLSEAAQIANLSETAFCRFFKQRTLKTFKEVVNEMRISYACDLIIGGRLSSMTISSIARESGFNNLSNFNRQFKKITGKSPMQYEKEFTLATI